MSRTPVALALALAALGSTSVSCTAILAPRDDVQRCGTADDCEPTGDERYVPACRFDDPTLDADEFEKICVADFKTSVGCDPMGYTTVGSDPHPYRQAFDDLADSARYLPCEEDQLGGKGCAPPSGGGCNSGLSVDEETGLCDDGSPRAIEVTNETVGQDVRDQFCRAFFCDERFVCDTSSNTCVLCDPEEPFGEGGCGEVYIAGAPSCVYQTYSGPDDSACDDAAAGGTNMVDAVTFGACM